MKIFWVKPRDTLPKAIYASSSKKAHRIRSQLARNPNIDGITHIQSVKDKSLPLSLTIIIKGEDDGKRS